MNSELDLVFEFERDCMDLAKPVINKLCQRAMRSMNEKAIDYFKGEDYPDSFSFVDILSIKIQKYLLDEISPYLEGYISSTLDDEFNKLSPMEQLVIAYCDCTQEMQSNYNGYQPRIYATFRNLLDEHYHLKKIQNFVDRY